MPVICEFRVEIPDQEIVRTPRQLPDPVDVFCTYELFPEALALLEDFGANDDETDLTEKQNQYWDALIPQGKIDLRREKYDARFRRS